LRAFTITNGYFQDIDAANSEEYVEKNLNAEKLLHDAGS